MTWGRVLRKHHTFKPMASPVDTWLLGEPIIQPTGPRRPSAACALRRPSKDLRSQRILPSSEATSALLRRLWRGTGGGSALREHIASTSFRIQCNRVRLIDTTTRSFVKADRRSHQRATSVHKSCKLIARASRTDMPRQLHGSRYVSELGMALEQAEVRQRNGFTGGPAFSLHFQKSHSSEAADTGVPGTPRHSARAAPSNPARQTGSRLEGKACTSTANRLIKIHISTQRTAPFELPGSRVDRVAQRWVSILLAACCAVHLHFKGYLHLVQSKSWSFPLLIFDRDLREQLIDWLPCCA